jgi:hypothetical protein
MLSHRSLQCAGLKQTNISTATADALDGPTIEIPRSGLVQELLCGRPHKSSYSHSLPSGNEEAARHSIGAMNEAFDFGGGMAVNAVLHY